MRSVQWISVGEKEGRREGGVRVNLLALDEEEHTRRGQGWRVAGRLGLPYDGLDYITDGHPADKTSSILPYLPYLLLLKATWKVSSDPSASPSTALLEAVSPIRHRAIHTISSLSEAALRVIRCPGTRDKIYSTADPRCMNTF